ncbi:hypothetical protein B7494_g3341 [Chlorociboria aeruginascens]|nr:hypothetical protein B7494_g3341 [Chlorociboria aeruginascens]
MPPSPPPSMSEDPVQHNLHHLIQHNANTPYPNEQSDYDEGAQLPSNYSSPTPVHDDTYRYRGQQPRYEYQHQGVGPQYDGYNTEYQSSMYQDQYSTPATSPPTPSMHDTRRSGARQRDHQLLKPIPEGRPKANKSPRLKKIKKEKVKKENKVAKLTKPLSELTKDWTHVPVADIDAYINRSAEDRRKEVEEGKVPGKVKRPMNSFMLYRKAYQNRTKDWCLQNNHQVVSQVCGESWPLEPDEVKEQFSEWARIERINHQNAHPGYKFTPSKPGAAKAVKRKILEEPLSEESDLDDFDWQGGHRSRKKKLQRAAHREQPVQYPSTRSAYKYESRDSSVEPYPSYNRSSYQVNNPGQPYPAQYNQAGLQAGQYYQQTIRTHPDPRMANVEDVLVRKTTVPGHLLVGLPGGNDYDLMNQQQSFEGQPQEDYRIDPALLTQGQPAYVGDSYDQPHPDGVFFGDNRNGNPQWQDHYGMLDRDLTGSPLQYLDADQHLNSLPIQDDQMHALRGQQDGWQQVGTLDAGQEFDKWMDNENDSLA